MRFVEADYNDADSFRVRLPGKDEHVIRLYYVDAPETSFSGTESVRRRVLEQSRYFGLEEPRQVVHFGREAAAFVKDTLKNPFTVHTALARAPGRSKKPRIYAMVHTSDGEDLAKLLVENGLARAHGIRRALPNQTPASEYSAVLADLEIAAGLKRAGIWAATNTDRIAELRRQPPPRRLRPPPRRPPRQRSPFRHQPLRGRQRRTPGWSGSPSTPSRHSTRTRTAR